MGKEEKEREMMGGKAGDFDEALRLRLRCGDWDRYSEYRSGTGVSQHLCDRGSGRGKAVMGTTATVLYCAIQ